MLPVDLWTWLGLVLSAAGLLTVHFSLLLRTVRMLALTPGERLLALLVPPLTTYYAFRIGVRRRAVLWWVLLTVYLVLWSLQ